MKVELKRVLDIPAHAKAVRKCARRALIRQASYAMKITRRQLRKRKTISQPGEVPSLHAPGLKRMRFAMQGDYALIYGPIAEGRMGEPVPKTLEHGGTSKRGKRQEPRPFMAPGLEKARSQKAWLDVVRDTYSSVGIMPPASGGSDS